MTAPWATRGHIEQQPTEGMADYLAPLDELAPYSVMELENQLVQFCSNPIVPSMLIGGAYHILYEINPQWPVLHGRDLSHKDFLQRRSCTITYADFIRNSKEHRP